LDTAGLTLLVTGSGSPVTVFVPGLGGAIPHLRPLGGGVPGTRVFCEVHGDEAPDDYTGLAAAVRTVADRFAAKRALGVSLGAGVLLRLMAETPDRFSRVVIYQPSALDVAELARLEQLAELIRLSGDVGAMAALLNDELPVDVRGARQSREASAVRAERLARPEGLRLLKNLTTGEPPVADPGRLSAATAQVLVIAAQGDPVHPVGVAEAIAAAFPYGQLRVFDQPAPLWHARAELRALISGFLARTAEEESASFRGR
jgi:3-oxoadipate enol-lactonase